jgi:hypothetical protein
MTHIPVTVHIPITICRTLKQKVITIYRYSNRNCAVTDMIGSVFVYVNIYYISRY